MGVEENSIVQGRICNLASYVDYLGYVSKRAPTDFEDVNGNAKTVDLLRQVYGQVDRVEFYVGIFAEYSPDQNFDASTPDHIDSCARRILSGADESFDVAVRLS